MKRTFKIICTLLMLTLSLNVGMIHTNAASVSKVSGIKAVSNNTGKINVSFNKIKKAKYVIAYSTSSKNIGKLKKGKLKKIKNVKYKKVSKNSADLSNLKSGNKYYIRICAYKTVKSKKTYSAWSKKISLKPNGSKTTVKETNNNNSNSSSSTNKNISVDNKKIYALDSWAEKYISIPSNIPQKAKITVTGASNVSYKTSENSNIQVSSNGVVTPKYIKYYWTGGVGTTMYNPNADSVTSSIDYGPSSVLVIADGNRYTINVEVESYSSYYANEVMDKYIETDVNTKSTAYEKITAITKFPALYDYSVYHSSAEAMIICGGGDCWASTDAIVSLCKKIGIKAHARNATMDAGAGSSHMNAVAVADGKYYICEAGYNEKAPRAYTITKYDQPFMIYRRGDTATIQSYFGDDIKDVVVPETYDGAKVTEIGYRVFYGHGEINSIKLPATITTIGESAFYRCEDLTTINIPASVNDINNFAFVCVDKLSNVSFDPNNMTYSFDNGVVYDKNKTKVITSMVTNGTVNLPSTVTSIGEYAFYTNESIKNVNIPSSVKTIGEGAFGNCEKMSEVTGCLGITEIDAFAFAHCDALSTITLPESTNVDKDAFKYSSTQVVRQK